MDIIVYYGTEEVARYHVDNPFGCRLFYFPNLEEKMSAIDLIDPTGTEFQLAFGSRARTQINLPTPSKDSLQANVLEGFQRGLLLDFVSNDLFATRLCRCAVYCNDNRRSTGDEGKLYRKERTRVFEYRDRFLPLIRNHCKNSITHGCPSSELFMTLGTTWNTVIHTAEQSIVSLAIVHCLARSQIQAKGRELPFPKIAVEIEDLDEADKNLEEALKKRIGEAGARANAGHQDSSTSSSSVN
jgi:hypothetical protein